jgi:hypothetical protein
MPAMTVPETEELDRGMVLNMLIDIVIYHLIEKVSETRIFCGNRDFRCYIPAARGEVMPAKGRRVVVRGSGESR